MEKIIIGNSDCSRKEMEEGDYGWTVGTTAQYFLSVIKKYEDLGYEVKFQTSIWRKLFGISEYKVIAVK